MFRNYIPLSPSHKLRKKCAQPSGEQRLYILSMRSHSRIAPHLFCTTHHKFTHTHTYSHIPPIRQFALTHSTVHIIRNPHSSVAKESRYPRMSVAIQRQPTNQTRNQPPPLSGQNLVGPLPPITNRTRQPCRHGLHQNRASPQHHPIALNVPP